MMLVHQKIQKYITEHRIPQAYIAEQCGISEDIFNAMLPVQILTRRKCPIPSWAWGITIPLWRSKNKNMPPANALIS